MDVKLNKICHPELLSMFLVFRDLCDEDGKIIQKIDSPYPVSPPSEINARIVGKILRQPPSCAISRMSRALNTLSSRFPRHFMVRFCCFPEMPKCFLSLRRVVLLSGKDRISLYSVIQTEKSKSCKCVFPDRGDTN